MPLGKLFSLDDVVVVVFAGAGRGVREGGSGGSSGPPWRRTVNGVGL